MKIPLRTDVIGLLTLLLLLAAPYRLCAQGMQVVFDEDFKDNHNQWPVISDDDKYMIVQADGYHVEYRTPGSFWNAAQDVKVNPSFDYAIELSFNQSFGTDDDGVGLIYGKRDIDNFHAFIISPQGKARVFYQVRGKEADILPWTAIPAIKPNGSVNVLRVEHHGDATTFFINGVRVHSTREHRIDGSYAGVVVSDVHSVDFKRLKAWQNRLKINVASSEITGFHKVNLGPNVNTDSAEVMPLISSDGKTLYFTRKRDPHNVGGATNDDIWVSYRQPDESWGTAENIGAPLNNAGHNNAVSISPDNNTMLVMNKYAPDGSPGGGGFSITHRKGDSWELPQAVQIDNYYNDDKYTEACLGPDGRTMLLTLDRKDSYGQRDVYVSFARPDNTWTEPKNLGPVVNTYQDETSPFLAADGVTLYYSTEGFPGYGDQDIFMTRRLDDTWQNWSEPQNLGPEINSDDWDAFYTIPASGELAYIVSSKNAIGSTDIFQIKLAEQAKPKPVVLVKGRVLNSKTKEPMETQIIYSDLANNREIGSARSDSKDGSYQIVLPVDRIYSFYGGKTGFYSIADTVNVKDVKEYQEITRDLYLTPIEAMTAIRMNNIFFDFDKSELLKESSAELERLVTLMKRQPLMQVEIRGHADIKGTDEYNQKLSEDRALAVVEYLAGRGIDRSRLTSRGFGKSMPISTNETEEGRAQNRRVEFMILKM